MEDYTVLATVSLMVALDATILVPVLPVSRADTLWGVQLQSMTFSGDQGRPSWK